MIRPTTVRVTLTDPDGSVALDYEQPARSYVQQMIQRLRSLFRSADEANVRETGNTLTTVTVVGGNLMSLLGGGAPGGDDRSVVVGSGTTAVAIDDFALATQITHGVAAGQLQYQDVTAGAFGAVSVVGDAASFTVPRAFINGSGGDVTVNETGLFAIMPTDVPGIDFYCIARDVLGTPVVVGDGQTLTVTYTLSESV